MISDLTQTAAEDDMVMAETLTDLGMIQRHQHITLSAALHWVADAFQHVTTNLDDSCEFDYDSYNFSLICGLNVEREWAYVEKKGDNKYIIWARPELDSILIKS